MVNWSPGIINRISGTNNKERIILDNYADKIRRGELCPPPEEFSKWLDGTQTNNWKLDYDKMTGIYTWRKKIKGPLELTIAATPFWNDLEYIPIDIEIIQSSNPSFPRVARDPNLQQGTQDLISFKYFLRKDETENFFPNTYLNIMRNILVSF